MKKPELLSPAGSLETALAAFDGGADAVYCGLAKFNARERAVNFSFPELRTLLERARNTQKKVYITFNTLLKDHELDEAASFLAELAKSPPDALIVQDPGVINLVNKYFPFFTLHASTQMGIHNSCGIEAMAQLNIKRVILERQITLDELKIIRKNSPLELEVFINGSLCCSLSGRCLLSSYLNGTSGNRGRCKQPCRRCYAAVDNSKADYFLSPYDLDGSTLVKELSDIGIDSFKIEGRLRGSDYIYKTARAYRLLIDHPDEPEAAAEAAKLLFSSSMRGTSGGFYFKSGHSKVINSGRSGIFGIEAGTVSKCRNGYLTLKTSARLHLGDRLRAVDDKTKSDHTFSLTAIEENHRSVIKCRAGSNVIIGVAPEVKPGAHIFKIGENGFDYRSAVAKLRPGRYPAELRISAGSKLWKISFSRLPEFVWEKETDFQPAQNHPVSENEIAEIFSSSPAEPWRIDRIKVDCQGRFFVPGSVLKNMRREFWQAVKSAMPPFEQIFRQESVALERYLAANKKGERSIKIDLPEEYFSIPDFISQHDIDKVTGELEKYLASGKRNVVTGAFHGLAMLKNAPEDVNIFVRFPLPAANTLAAELLSQFNVTAFEPEPELDSVAFNQLIQSAALPHFENDSPLPLLVTRAAIDRKTRTDGSGNTLFIQENRSEKTIQLFVKEQNPREKFKKNTLL